MAACGDAPPARVALDLAPAYDAAGVVRVTRALRPEPELRPFRMRLEDMRLAGGRIQGRARGPAAPALELDARFDPSTDQVRFEGGAAALTSTRAERVTRLGFRLEEGGPADGVASELVGFVATATAGVTTDGRWVAVEARSDRLPPPDASLITVRASPQVGRVVVQGAEGASPRAAGLQILRFSPERAAPEVFGASVRSGGAFELELPGAPGDVLLLRAQIARRSSDAAVVEVPNAL
jgi:hypothetical protein